MAAEAAILQTDRSEVRSEMVSKEMVNLPVLLGRNDQQLFRSLPGFAPPANAHSVPTNPSRALAFNVYGSSRSSNNTRIDGASSTVIQLLHIVAYVPSLESIETVNVVTNSFDAEQGLAGGAAISVQTKSGTNDLHGAGFEYISVQALKAKPFFLPVGQNKPKLVYNQFGGAVAGRSSGTCCFISWPMKAPWTARPPRALARCRPPRSSRAICRTQPGSSTIPIPATQHSAFESAGQHAFQLGCTLTGGSACFLGMMVRLS